MTAKDLDPALHQSTPAPAPKQGHQFVERMFSGFGHRSELPRVGGQRAPEEPYRPVRQRQAAEARYILQTQPPSPRVGAESPASDVMTDLTRVAAVTIRSVATVEQAHQAMIAYGVRALFVVDDAKAVLGVITSTDVLGERPVRMAQQRGLRHVEVLVRDVMTPADRLESMDYGEVLQARVGDIVETLKRAGRQHALVIEAASHDTGAPTYAVRGIFSLTQIARQLGLAPQAEHDVARTFAEIEAAIGA
jgi:hypothetical protein